MKVFKSALLMIISLLFLASCQQNKKEVIADKIQYDVNIKSPDPEYDWWIQNLPGPQREYLVNTIIDGALSGKFQSYDYFYSPLSPGQVASVLSDTTFLTILDEEPPYTERDTILVYNIQKADIQRIRFLEEWYIDPETLASEKKVLGIAPIAKRIDVSGIERWQPLFWIFVDKDFVAELEKSNP